jgi:protein-disulfide isomerase
MMVPGAILVAGLVLAAAVYEYRAPIHLALFGSDDTGTIATFDPPSPNDHRYGDPAAPVQVIEYCDIGAPYCKQFQGVMDALMQTYAPSGKVAWIYRQFPVKDADANADQNAAAAECASIAGGTAGFFGFLDAVAQAAPGSQGFDPSTASAAAQAAGIPADAFQACLTDGGGAKAAAGAYDKAVAAGATGVPYLILVTQGHAPNAIAGALSYDAMKALIDQSLSVAGAQ